MGYGHVTVVLSTDALYNATYFLAIFLPAMAFGLPFRVRALVFVFWPLTGKPCTKGHV